jgi:hypothetical protein
MEGAVAGIAIALIDLVLFGRRFPRIRALEPGQLADHFAFESFAAVVLARQKPAE